MRSHSLLGWLILSGLVTVAGCSSHPAPPTAPAPPAAADLDIAAAVLTTDVRTLRDGWRLFSAQQRLVAECMHSHGLQYLVTDPGPEPTAGTVTAEAIGGGRPATYGIAAELSAQGNGGNTIPAQDQYVRHLPLAQQGRYEQALGGSPNALQTLRLASGIEVQYRTGGCVGQARRRLFGSVETALRDSMVPQDVGQTFDTFLLSEATYHSALSSWQRCMAGAGWSYTNPRAAIKALGSLSAQGTSLKRLSARETVVAMADSRCDKRSHLRDTRRLELTKFLRQQPNSLIQQLLRVDEARRRAVQVAVRVLAGAPVSSP